MHIYFLTLLLEFSTKQKAKLSYVFSQTNHGFPKHGELLIWYLHRVAPSHNLCIQTLLPQTRRHLFAGTCALFISPSPYGPALAYICFPLGGVKLGRGRISLNLLTRFCWQTMTSIKARVQHYMYARAWFPYCIRWLRLIGARLQPLLSTNTLICNRSSRWHWLNSIC